MKILVIGDLHGRKPRIHFKDFDCIVQIGDVCCDKELGPIFKKAFKVAKETPEKVKGGFGKFIDLKFGKRAINKMEKKSLEVGKEILKYLDSFAKPIFFIPGNWDDSWGKTRIKDRSRNSYVYLKSFLDEFLGEVINKKLVKGLKNLRSCQFEYQCFNDVCFVGYGLSNAPEEPYSLSRLKKAKINKEQYQRLKRAYKKIQDKLRNAYLKRDKKLPVIFLTHNIPYNTKLDIVENKDSYAYKKHLGSTIARSFCKKYQPLLCIGGHIHEGKGRDKIGKTIVINPGFGRDAQVLIDIDEKKKKIRKIKFWR